MASWVEALRRSEIVAVGAVLARRGLVRAREGNVSCRLPDGRILMTPRGADKGRLVGARLVVCEPDPPLPKEASSEALMHLETYRLCPGIHAIVHAHPGSVLGLEARGGMPDPGGLKEGEAVLGRVARVAALPPGGRELALACARALKRAPAAVMARHGLVAGGADLWEALARVETAELIAQIALARRAAALL